MYFTLSFACKLRALTCLSYGRALVLYRIQDSGARM